MRTIRRSSVLAVAIVLCSTLLGAGLPAQVTSAEELKFPPLRETAIPQPIRFELGNGMVVLLLEDHELPLIDVMARVRTGSRWEPADKIGLAGLTGTVLRTGGSGDRTGDQLDDLLEGRAASIETGIGTASGSASMSCLRADFAEMLGVFAEVLRYPQFDPDKLKVAKTQIEAGIARQNDDPNGIMFREWNEIVYGSDSPYARNATYDTINNIRREDLIAWHGKYFHPERIILGIVGDFDAEATRKLVESTFGSWPRGPGGADPEAVYNESVMAGVYYVQKDDMTQSNIIMGHLGIQKDDPDYYAVEVVNQILGGSFAARLFTNVRSKKALAYRVRGGIDSGWDYDGDFNMFMTTKVETTAAGIDALIEEARNLTAQPPTDEEVRKAKAALLNSFVFEYDSTREVLEQNLTYEYYGYPSDWLERYNKGIRQVTTDAVRAAAAKHIQPDRMAILVVGPKEGQDRPLSEFGTVAIVDVTIPEPSVAAVAETASSVARGKELVALAVEALGGAERVDSVRSIESAGSVVIRAPQGEMELQVATLTDFADGRMRQDLTLPFGKLTTVVTPDGGFLQSPQGIRPLPDSQRQEMMRDLLRNPLASLKLRGDASFKANATGSGVAGDTPVENVVIELRGEAMTFGIDPEDGRVLSVRYRGGVGMNQQPGDVVRTFGDFRAVDGLMVPFSTSATFNGEPATSSTLETVTVDGPLDDAAFAMPREDDTASR